MDASLKIHTLGPMTQTLRRAQENPSQEGAPALPVRMTKPTI